MRGESELSGSKYLSQAELIGFDLTQGACCWSQIDIAGNLQVQYRPGVGQTQSPTGVLLWICSLATLFGDQVYG